MSTAGTNELSRWLVRTGPRDERSTRMYCLPYAGGGTTSFRGWGALAERAGVEVWAVELPGHGRRVGEPPRIDVPELASVIAGHIDRPYVLFGHSLGARLAFELARRLVRDGHPKPAKLFVSGTPGPRLARVGAGDSALPQDEFVARVRQMGGTPATVLADKELRDLFLPVIRSDFVWGDAYTYQPGPALTCPVTAFAGSADPEASPEQMASWAQETQGSFRLRIFEGGHFFLHSHFDQLVGELTDELRPLTADRDPRETKERGLR